MTSSPDESGRAPPDPFGLAAACMPIAIALAIVVYTGVAMWAGAAP